MEGEIPQMNIELYLLDKLKSRVQLARQIDVAQHKAKKERHEKDWIKETADAMEIELDSNFADRCARLRLACYQCLNHAHRPVIRKPDRLVRLNASKRLSTQGSRIVNCN